MEAVMAIRPTAIAIFAALACAALPAVAPAQAPSNSPVPMPSETVNLTMEQRHIVKEIIIKDMKTPTTPAQAAAKVPTKPGEVVPSGVALQPMPVEVSAKVPQVRTHSFFVEDDKVIIVDPKDNKIAIVVE
jgi:hypothetical protein